MSIEKSFTTSTLSTISLLSKSRPGHRNQRTFSSFDFLYSLSLCKLKVTLSKSIFPLLFVNTQTAKPNDQKETIF